MHIFAILYIFSENGGYGENYVSFYALMNLYNLKGLFEI